MYAYVKVIYFVTIVLRQDNFILREIEIGVAKVYCLCEIFSTYSLLLAC